MRRWDTSARSSLNRFGNNRMKETFDVIRLILYNKNTNVTQKRFLSSSAPTSGGSTKTGQAHLYHIRPERVYTRGMLLESSSRTAYW